MMSVVMVIVMVVMRVTAFARRSAAHRHPTPFTELRRLRLHASRDPRDVGNNIRTKPHRVGRACLTRGVAALGGRAIETAEKHNGQHKCTGQVNNPHVLPQGLAIVVCAANVDRGATCSPKGGESTIERQRTTPGTKLAYCRTNRARPAVGNSSFPAAIAEKKVVERRATDPQIMSSV